MQSVETTPRVDARDLEERVQRMYSDVAENPHAGFHFETGRALALRLGYPEPDLDAIPAEAIESFAGVGYFYHLAKPRSGEHVLDLGSGSGMDSFIAGRAVGAGGRVVGVDMTPAQLNKAERLRSMGGFTQVSFIKGHIESVPADDASFDLVISNGVINLSPEKNRVFAEASRLLKPGGRLAIADIVTESQLPENVTCNATLWAACIGGAAQQDSYRAMIEAAGLSVAVVEENSQYGFLSKSARGAVETWGVKSVSLLAVKKG
jgi:ubiquinone/menaquinone biosynthesis C-methylase UbiE